MPETIVMNLADIQPSQLFINSEKLIQVIEYGGDGFNDPLPVIRLGGQIVLTDGHTRALAAFLRGLTEVSVYWDEDDLDLEAYAICVEWCREENIHTIEDLKDRLLPRDKYEILWIMRCQAMLHDLARRRGDWGCER